MTSMLGLFLRLWGETYDAVLLAAAASGPAGGRTKSLISVDLVRAVTDSDLIGHICYIVLAIFSIVSWAIIFYKVLHIRHATKQTDEFVDLCMSGSGSLDEAYKHAAEYPASPLAQVLRETYLELEVEGWYREAGRLDITHRLELAKVGIERILERTTTSEMRHLESYLIFLATTSAVAPFIGLFGTVWGILGGFQVLATYGTANFQILAPSIATALGTTVLGLIVAIPTTVFYNFLANKIQSIVTRMDSFALEISNVIQKRILQEGAR